MSCTAVEQNRFLFFLLPLICPECCCCCLQCPPVTKWKCSNITKPQPETPSTLCLCLLSFLSLHYQRHFPQSGLGFSHFHMYLNWSSHLLSTRHLKCQKTVWSELLLLCSLIKNTLKIVTLLLSCASLWSRFRSDVFANLTIFMFFSNATQWRISLALLKFDFSIKTFVVRVKLGCGT